MESANERYWEFWNTITHLIGAIAGLVGVVYVFTMRNDYGSILEFLGVLIYMISVCFLFTCSTLLHSSKYFILSDKAQRICTLFDYSAIYVLIAGTYTPFIILMYQTRPMIMWSWLIVVWLLALFGVFYQLKFNGKYKNFSTILYILLGWVIVFMFADVIKYVPFLCILLLANGGITYTLGTIFFSSEKPHMHTIWHIFVLAASISMFLAVVFMVKI